MPMTEKEYNGNLFDQLSLIERIERHLKSGGREAAEIEIDILKKEINRKLYQKPPSTENYTREQKSFSNSLALAGICGQ